MAGHARFRPATCSVKHPALVLFSVVSLATAGLAYTNAARGASAIKDQPLLRLETTVDAMGSTFTLILFGANEANLRTASDEAAEEAHRIDRLISNYQPSSEWSRLNREAADHPVEVSQEDFDLLQACVNYSRAS